MRRIPWHIIFVALLILFGCTSRENQLYSGLGHITFSVTVDKFGQTDDDKKVSLTLTSADGQYSHTWADINDFPGYESYHVGKYIAKAYIGEENAEGFGCPYYLGVTEFEVKEAETTDVLINCSLVQAVTTVDIINSSSSYKVKSVLLHTTTFGYVDIPQGRYEEAFIMPGETSCAVTIADSQNRTVNLATDLCLTTVAATKYAINVTLDSTNTLTVKAGGLETSVYINDEYFNTPAPSVTASGFDEGTAIVLTEGFPSIVPIAMNVSAAAGIQSMLLTAISANPGENVLPAESQLMDDSSPIIAMGIKVDKQSNTEAVVDFTTLFENIKVDTNTGYTFMLQVTDMLGRLSDPMTLTVSINGVAINIKSIDDAVIGVDKASVTFGINVPEVDPNDFELFVINGNVREKVAVTDAILNASKHELTLSFNVYEGYKPVEVEISYLNEHKLTCIVNRKVPEYQLSVDAFATFARINIVSPSHEIISAITKYAAVRVEDADIAVLSRDTDEGLIICSGLSPSTKYTLSTIVIEGQYQPEVSFSTESAQQLPDGDFEDTELSFEYKNMPSGGIYSSTTFPIYNKQNYADFKVFWPKKYWTSINAKTFCGQPTNRNTWFMQPSAYIDYSQQASGLKSICLTSVGWSFTGSEIAPYVQAQGSYQPYSGNTPGIDHISAGYLFLGSYTVDPSAQSETYNLGYGFTSRPTSLNGFYRYIPDINNINDRGWAQIELINKSPEGKETIIATGKMEFSNTSYFRSFNIPLVYGVYNLNATDVRVLFCSSVFSDGLTFDDPSVPVSANLPEACYKGSALWIDNLSFSY